MSSTPFSAFYTKIPETTLPFICYCNKQLTPFKTGISDSAVKKYSNIADAMVYKRLPTTGDNYCAIIYLIPADVQVPVLVTYNDSGKEISRLNLYEKHCGEDELSSGLTWADITIDKKIIVHDSSSDFERDKQGNILEETRKIRVKSKNYSIDKTGKITLEKETSERVYDRKHPKKDDEKT
jgi:hypothetical protein